MPGRLRRRPQTTRLLPQTASRCRRSRRVGASPPAHSCA
jgi:hypothetical protein